MTTYTLSGSLIPKNDDIDVAELRLELWDNEATFDKLVALAISDDEGRFELRVEPADTEAIFGGRPAIGHFVVIRGERDVVADTRDRITWHIDRPSPPVRIPVGEPIGTIDGLAKLHVTGRIYDADDGPMAGVRVTVYDFAATTDGLQLGEVDLDVDDHGLYVVAYDHASIASGKQLADIRVTVQDLSSGGIIATRDRCQAQALAVLDVVVGGAAYEGPREYAAALAAVDPALSRIDIDTLTDEQVVTLACASRRGVDEVMALRDAAVLESATGVPAETAYGMLRMGSPGGRRPFLEVPAADQRRRLERASVARIVGNLAPQDLDDAFDQIVAAQVFFAFDAPEPDTSGNLGDVIRIATGESAPAVPGEASTTCPKAHKFLDLHFRNEGPLDEFWDVALPADTDLGSIAGRLRRVVQYALLSRYHLPLVAKLDDRHESGTPSDMYDLAMLQAAQWRGILDTIATDPVPVGMPGANLTEQKDNYAQVLAITMQTVMPTAAIAGAIGFQVGTGDNRYKALSQNRDFAFNKTRIATLFADPTSDLSGIDPGDYATAKGDLEKVERLYKVTQKWDEIDALMNDPNTPVTSAQAITKMGKSQFIAKFGGALGGAEKAGKAYGYAEQSQAYATMMVMNYSAQTNSPSMYAVPDYLVDSPTALEDPKLADWSSIFGSLDQCMCAHGASVFSPSAYLYDLLRFLDRYDSNRNKSGGGKWTAKELLLGIDETQKGRREDIKKLVLSDRNATTPLPYVDLVVEILERRVTGAALPERIEVGKSAEGLLAEPEIIDVDDSSHVQALATLSQAIFPGLPYALGQHQARTFLEHLGVGRDQLMTELDAATPPPAELPLVVAQERLGLTKLAREVIVDGIGPAPAGNDLWGLDEASWEEDLKEVRTFMQAASVEYAELEELLGTAFVQALAETTPQDVVRIEALAGTDPCKLDNLRIVGMRESTPPASILADGWIAVQRFLRLRNALGWGFAELDVVVEALSTSGLDDPLIVALADVVELHRRTGAPLDEMAAWWEDIETRGIPSRERPSLYDRLFRNDSLPENDAFELPLEAPFDPIVDHVDHVLAGLAIDAGDYAVLADESVAASRLRLPRALPVGATGDELSLPNLSRLYRCASLARALGLRPHELRVLQALTGLTALAGDDGADSPPPTTTPHQTLVLADELQRLRGAGIRVADVHYLTRHVIDPGSGISAYADQVAATEQLVHAATQKVVASTPYPEVATSDELRALLLDLLDVENEDGDRPDLEAVRKLIERVVAVVEGRSTDAPDGQETTLDEALEALLAPAVLANVKAALVHPAYALSSCRHWFEGPQIDEADGQVDGWGPRPGVTLTNQLAQVTMAKKPGYVEAGPGNRPAIELFDDGHVLTMDINVQSASYTLCFVVDQRAAESLVRTIAEVTDGSSELRVASDAQSGPDPSGKLGIFASASGGGSGWELGDHATLGEQTLVFVFNHAANTCTIHRDGVPLPTVMSYTNHVELKNTLTLGGATDAAFRGLIGLFGVFEGALSGADLILLHAELARYRGQVEPERFDAIVRPLVDHLRLRDAAAAVVQTVAKALDLSPLVVDALVHDVLGSFSTAGQPLIVDFLPSTGSPVTYPIERGAAMTLLGKAGWLVRKLGLHERELLWLVDPPAGNPGWLDLADLTIDPDPVPADSSDLTGARERYAALTRLIDVLSIRRAFQHSDGTLITLWDAAGEIGQEAAFFEAMAKQLNWPLEDLSQLTSAWALVYPATELDPNPYRDDRVLVRLVRAITLLRRLGLSARDALAWLNPDEAPADSLATARAITRVARSKYDADAWTEIARPLRDEVRNAHRDALVRYAIGDRSDEHGNDLIHKEEDLYDSLLIDTEMSACQLTSRILLAISSVQLFVNRALLGLEPDFTLADDAAARQELSRHWKWMSSYRVWEANRKIFLYPENWVEPEWRMNKSHLFTQLESELSQGFLTEERAESAYRNYAAGLDLLAKLDVVAFVEAHVGDGGGAGPRRDVHVLARENSHSANWYHRILLKEREWTPWSPIDAELPRHLVPFVHEGRLNLVSVRTSKAAPITNGTETQELPDRHTITVSRHDFTGGVWRHRGTVHTPETLNVGNEFWLGVYYGRADHSIAIGAQNANEGWITMRLNGCSGMPAEFPVASDVFTRSIVSLPTYHDSYYGRLIAGFWFDGKAPPLEVHAQESSSAPVELLPLLDNSEETGRLVLLERAYAREEDGKFLDGTLKTPISRLFLLDSARNLHGYKVDVPPRRESFVHKRQLSSSGVRAARVNGIDFLFSYIGPKRIEWLKFRFESFSHPYVCDVSRAIDSFGIDFFREGALQLDLQRQNFEDMFETRYDPVPGRIARPYPRDAFEFGFRGAYSQYNWEVFFHVPFLLAEQLRKEGRHEEARKWYHAIFNPTEASLKQSSGVNTLWRVKPFADNDDVASIQEQLAAAVALADKEEVAKLQKGFGLVDDDDVGIEAQLEAWRDNPFDPHLVARMRPLAYQKATVMRYIENLIDWGDKLFRRDTMESVNEATQIYLMAQALLGPRPVFIDDPMDTPAKTYEELEADDETGNFFIKAESLIFDPEATFVESPNPPPGPVLIPYFCFPPNEKLLGYWDTVEDRLYKIRHCLNIEGRFRQLPLFQPPIDPALLIEANIAGLDFASVLDQLAAPMPIYRFNVVLVKAVELAQVVNGYGAALLAVVEKIDTEALTLLRQGHERRVLALTKQTRLEQIREARDSLEALQRTRSVAEERRAFYASVPRISPKEKESQQKASRALSLETQAQQLQLTSSVMFAMPQLHAQAVASGTSFGGENLGEILKALSQRVSIDASRARFESQEAATDASYERRWNEWKLQERLADRELAQIDKQMDAARARVAIAERDLATLEQQIADAEELETFLKEKFTRLQLHEWMRERLAGVYFQAYKTAYEVASAAQAAYRFERGEPTATFLKFGYWDDRRAGFLAAEQLLVDLRRMDVAYLEKNRREYELTTHISLAERFPLQLLQLKETGKTEIELPEALFDRAYPGHYMRRIKSVTMTVPGVTGPYSGVNCTLTMLSSKIRKDTALASDYEEEPAGGDGRFIYNYGTISSVCTSSGQNDGGVFELNFRDERYLPFEGAGAVSRWRIELPQETNDFDVRTVTDVIIHLNYMAREGGSPFKEKALAAALDAAPRTVVRLFSLRNEFAAAWNKFEEEPFGEAAGPPKSKQTLEVDLEAALPFLPGTGEIVATKLMLAAVWRKDVAHLPSRVAAPGEALPSEATLVPQAPAVSAVPLGTSPIPAAGSWTIQIEVQDLPEALIEEVDEDVYRIKPSELVDIVAVLVAERGTP